MTTASVRSLAELGSFFLIVDSCYSSSLLSDTSFTAEAYKHLQQYRPLSDGQIKRYKQYHLSRITANNDTELQAKLGSNVISVFLSLSLSLSISLSLSLPAPSSAQSDSSRFLNPKCLEHTEL